MKALILNNTVINLSNTEYPDLPGMFWIDCPDDCQPGWKYMNGKLIKPEEPKPTPKEQIDSFNNAIQYHIDSTAQSRGYANGALCVSYWISTVQSWSEDAKVFGPWRDQVWQLTLAAIEPFKSGVGELPNIDSFISLLPQIVWPS